MKANVKRTIAMFLCVLAVFSLFPMSADAAGYGALSSKKVAIKYPSDFFYEVYTAKITGGTKGSGRNGVYIVPRPETGNGDLGTVKNGSKVVLLAEKGSYYFFMTTSGKLGWAPKKYFTSKKTVDSGYLFGSSGLTVDHIEYIKGYLTDEKCGYASKKFYANRAVLVMKKGEKKNLSIYRGWNVTCWTHYYPGDVSIKQIGRSLHFKNQIKAKSKGSTYLRFTNARNSQEFYVVVIVT